MTERPHMAGRTIWRGCLTFPLITVIGVIVLGGAWYVSHDVACVNAASLWLPAYPSAVHVERVHTFVRPWGIGETAHVLVTDDTVDVVRGWYQNHDEALVHSGKLRTDGLARMRWFIREHEAGGSIILLFSNCTSGIALF